MGTRACVRACACDRVQRRPFSPPPTKSTSPGRNTPTSLVFGNPYGKHAATSSEDDAPAVVRFSVDNGVTRPGEGPHTQAGGLLGVEEAVAEGGGGDAKPGVAGEGWGDIGEFIATQYSRTLLCIGGYVFRGGGGGCSRG